MYSLLTTAFLKKNILVLLFVGSLLCNYALGQNFCYYPKNRSYISSKGEISFRVINSYEDLSYVAIQVRNRFDRPIFHKGKVYFSLGEPYPKGQILTAELDISGNSFFLILEK